MGEPIIEGSLTGARRYRKEYNLGEWYLVLQVQINTWVPASEVRPDAHWGTMWRDATPEDLVVTGGELVGS